MKKKHFLRLVPMSMFAVLFILMFLFSPVHGAGNSSQTSEVNIWTAAELGDTQAIFLQLSKGIDINGRDSLGKTPLMRCMTYNEIETAVYLISRGADVAVTDRFFNTSALHYASLYGYLDMSKMLISKGADPKKKNGDGRDALAIAVFHGHKNLAEYYIDSQKMDIETIVTPREGDTLLMHAARKGFYGMVKMLLAKGADKNKKSRTGMKAADYAASSNITEVLELVKEKGDKTYDVTQASTLVYSAYSDDTEEIKNAIDSGADPNVSYLERGGQISGMATDAISGLFARMINTGIITTSAVTPLTVAAAMGKIEAARYLISRGAKPDYVTEKGCHTPLMVAINFGNFDIAKLLINSGADVNAKSTRNDTPLLLAVHMGADEIVKVLLEKGADASAADRDGKTPLLHALESCNSKVINLFKERGIDAKKQPGSLSKGYGSPLFGAIGLENPEMVKYLIDLGADVNFKTPYHATPLLQTVNYPAGYYAIAKILIDAGANVSASLGQGGYSEGPDSTTVLNSAIEQDYLEIVKLFIENGHEIKKAQIERSLRNQRSPRVTKFFSELGFAATRNNIENTWELKGFPRELGKKISREYNRQNGSNTAPSEEISDKTEKEDIDIKNSQGETALQRIMLNINYEPIARILVENGASVNIASGWAGTPLTRAIENKNYDFCEYLISKGASVNILKPDTRHPIIEAIGAGDRKIYDLLLKHGADAPFGTSEIQSVFSSNHKMNRGSLELLFDFAKKRNVSFDNDANMRKNIIVYFQNIDLKYFYDNKLYGMDKIDTSTVMLFANEKKRDSIPKAIFIAGLIKMKHEDLDEITKKALDAQSDRSSLANLSVQGCNAGFARYCISKKTEMDFSEKSQIITLAMHSDDPDIIELGMELIDKSDIEQIYNQCSMAHGGENSVACLLKHGRIATIKKFIEKFPGLKRRYFSSSLIYPALESRNYEVLKYIIDNLDCSSQFCDDKQQIAKWVIETRDEKAIKLLKNAGFDLAGRNGADVLYEYINNGNLEKFRKEYESGTGAEHFKIEKNNYLLSTAAGSGRIDFVKYLIDKGENINAKDYVDEALGRGDFKMADYLITRGAKYKSLESALNYAIENEDLGMVDFVFSKGIDTSVQSYFGTPAFRAVKKGNVVLMKKLIEKGIYLAKPSKEEKKGGDLGANELFHAGGMSSISKYEEKSTLLNCAIDNRNIGMAELLAKYVPDINLVGNNGKCALELALLKNFTSVALEIIKRKEFEPGFLGAQKALWLAVLTDNALVVDELVKKGVKYDGMENSEIIREKIKKDGRGIVLAALSTLSVSGNKPEVIYKTLLASGASSGEILFNAIRASNSGLIDYSLGAGADTGYVHSDKRTPLCVAVESGDTPLAKNLILRGANAKGRDPYERPLIVLAAQKQGLDMVKTLVENGADIDSSTPFGLTALYASLKESKSDVVKYLLGKKPDMKIPLSTAVRNNEYSIVKLLLDNGADPNAPAAGEYPLAISKKAGFVAITDLLKSKGANDDYENRSAAADEIFKRIRECKSDFDFAKVLAPLPDLNIRNGNGDSLISVLLANYKAGRATLQYAISRGVDLNGALYDGRTILMRIVGCGVILDEKALDKIKDLYFKDSFDRTVLFHFYPATDLRIIELLKKKGLDIEQKDVNGNTPLLAYAAGRDVEIVRAFIRNGADFKARNAEGKNAIMLLVEYDDNREDVKSLIKQLNAQGIDINQVDNAGNTALHLACQKNNISGVKFLLLLGADTKIKNKEGKTPFSVSISQNYYNKVARFLLKKGANIEIDPKKALEPEGLKELMECMNETLFRTLIDNNIDRLPELNEEFIKTLFSGYRDEKAMMAILQIAKKRGIKPDVLWKLIFENLRGEDNVVTSLLLKNGSRELIDYLKSKGMKIEYKNAYQSGINVAIEAGNLDAIDYLLEKSGKKTSETEILSVMRTALDKEHEGVVFSLFDRLSGTTEIDARRMIFDKFSYNYNLEGLKKLVESEKSETVKRALMIEILDNAGCKNDSEYFESVVNAFDLTSDSQAIELIKKRGWIDRLKK